MSKLWGIKFYITENGINHAEDWLSKQRDKMQNKADFIIRYLEITALPWPSAYYEKLKGYEDLHELRIQCGGNPYRLFGCFGKHNDFIVFNGAEEKGKKKYNPPNAMDNAEKYRKQFIAGKGKTDVYRGPKN